MSLAITPDGKRYLSMGKGQREPVPYHLRFGLPFVLRENLFAWVVSAWLGIAVCAAAVWVLAIQHGLTLEQASVASVLWLGLPSTRFLFRAPVLVDAQGMALALCAAVVWPVYPLAAVGIAVVAASVWEKAPVFAALFAWSPWLLVGLVVPGIRYLLWSAPPVQPEDVQLAHMESRIATGLVHRPAVWRSADSMLWPWGACLAALFAPGLWWGAAWAVASAQILVAYDTVRLIQHAAPAVCIAAAGVIPVEWALPVVVLHWFNPKMGSGV